MGWVLEDKEIKYLSTKLYRPTVHRSVPFCCDQIQLPGAQMTCYCYIAHQRIKPKRFHWLADQSLWVHAGPDLNMSITAGQIPMKSSSSVDYFSKLDGLTLNFTQTFMTPIGSLLTQVFS